MRDWMQIRRIAGIGLMTVGVLVAAFFAALGVAVVANYIEPENPADGLSTVAVLTVPGIVAGVIVLALGRWLYGGWRGEAPLLRAARIMLPVAGLVSVAVFGVLLVALLVTGFGAEDWLSALKHWLGVASGVGTFLLGRSLRPSASKGVVLAS